MAVRHNLALTELVSGGSDLIQWRQSWCLMASEESKLERIKGTVIYP